MCSSIFGSDHEILSVHHHPGHISQLKLLDKLLALPDDDLMHFNQLNRPRYGERTWESRDPEMVWAWVLMRQVTEAECALHLVEGCTESMALGRSRRGNPNLEMVSGVAGIRSRSPRAGVAKTCGIRSGLETAGDAIAARFSFPESPFRANASISPSNISNCLLYS